MTFVQVADASHPGDRVTASGAAAYGTAQRVIVGIDDTPAGQAALHWAVIKARSDGAQLIAVRAWALGLPRHGGRRHRHPDRSPVVFKFAGDSQREAATALVHRAFLRTAGGEPRDIAVRIEITEGDPAVVLTQVAVADGDLLVLGDHHASSVHRIVHGSVGRYCAAHSRCPVVIVSPTGAAVATAQAESGPQARQTGRHGSESPDQAEAGPDQAQVGGA
jgi:nucleotide-binding universal stress UspA family protein